MLLSASALSASAPQRLSASAQGFGVLRDHAKRTDAFGAEDFVALRDRARRSDVLGAEGFAAL